MEAIVASLTVAPMWSNPRTLLRPTVSAISVGVFFQRSCRRDRCGHSVGAPFERNSFSQRPPDGCSFSPSLRVCIETCYPPPEDAVISIDGLIERCHEVLRGEW